MRTLDKRENELEKRGREAIVATGLAVSVAVCLAATIIFFTRTAISAGPGCFSCHGAEAAAKEQYRGIPPVDVSVLGNSTHKKINCTDCHTDALFTENEGKNHPKNLSEVDCAKCHYKGNTVGAPQLTPMDDLKDSIHGAGTRKKYGNDLPKCKDCHGTHEIYPKADARSRTDRLNIPATCIRCHADSGITERHKIKGEVAKAYLNSVHGRALKETGLNIAAVCVDCHGVHDIRAPGDPKSKVSRPNIPETCRKCHAGIYKQYIQGIHGQELLKGNKDTPVCTDCHGEHTIRSHRDPESRVYPTHVSKTCSHCHDDVILERKYSLPARRLSTYSDSYHGVALKYGDKRAANCASCHGTHDIRPSSDPESSINPENLPGTCGKCHPNAGKRFAQGKIHVEATKDSNPGKYYVRKFYTWFISIIIGCLVLYIISDLASRLRKATSRR